MPSWFDITTLPPGPDEFDEDAISMSVATIENLIHTLVQSGANSQRIVLIGFSQGAATSMMVSLKTRHTLGGVVSLSGWIPPRARDVSGFLFEENSVFWLTKVLKQSMKVASHDLPILWCHGTTDDEIPISYGEDAIAFLRYSRGVPQTRLQFLVYEGLEHTTRDDELRDVASWLDDILQE
jgi:lysophospholipase-2